MALVPLDRPRWKSLAPDPRRAKSTLRAILGDDWIDPASGVYRFAQRPWIDLEQIPADDEAAFAYCCDRGDLLPEPGYASVDWIEEARVRYHERLARITARLIEAEADPAAVDGLLARVRRVLSDGEIVALSASADTPPSVQASDSGAEETLLARLEGDVGDPTARPARVVADIGQLIDTIEGRAIARQPLRKEVLDRASVLLSYYHRAHQLNVEDLVWRLANSRMYASDLTGAFEELRPWVESPTASAGALCIAGLLNLQLGWVNAAYAAFSAALDKNRSPEFEVILREKRDVQIPQGQGQNRSELARQLRDSFHFDALSTGARASVYCNEAKGSGAMSALRLYQTARKLDLAAENPHYELNVARAAERTGNSELARGHLHTFGEMLQTQTAISLRHAQLMLRAEQIERDQTNPHARSSRRARGRLKEADALYAAVAHGRRGSGDIAGTCAALLKQARVALALGHPESAFEHAHAVTRLAPSRCERLLPLANQLQAKAAGSLDAAARSQLTTAALVTVTSIERGLPAPLLPHGASTTPGTK